MSPVEVKIVWFSRDDSEAAEKSLADLLDDGWEITHVSGLGSESHSVDVGPDQIVPAALATRQRAVGFVILQKRPRGGAWKIR